MPSSNQIFKTIMESNGFSIWPRGGGFQAYGKSLLETKSGDDDIYVLVTYGDNEVEIPDNADPFDSGAITVGIYRGEELVSSDSYYFYSLESFFNTFAQDNVEFF